MCVHLVLSLIDACAHISLCRLGVDPVDGSPLTEPVPSPSEFHRVGHVALHAAPAWRPSAQVMRCERASLHPRCWALIVVHNSGSSIGLQTEMQALKKVADFRNPCAGGSFGVFGRLNIL